MEISNLEKSFDLVEYTHIMRAEITKQIYKQTLLWTIMLNIKKVKYKVAAVKIQSYTKTQLHDEKALD